MIRRRTRRVDGDAGSQVVEFALVVPLLLVIVGAIIQFGFMFNAQVTITQAAREGARDAAICNQDADCLAKVPAKVVGAAPGITITTDQVSITACPSTPTAPPADAVVIVTYESDLGAPLLSQSITLHGKAHFPCGG